MSVRRLLSGLVALSVVLAACSGSTPATASPSDSPAASASASPGASPSASASASPTAKPTPSPTAAPTPTPTPSAFTLDSTVWWSGYVIHVTDGTFDPLKHILHVNATFQNTATDQVEVSTIARGLKVVWNGQFIPGYVTPGPVPVGATATAQIQITTPPGFVVADTVLAFGAPDEHQALVPLNGSPATSEQPVSLTVAGALKMGLYASFTVTKGLLIPAGCTGYPDRMKYTPLKKNEVSIVLWGTATSSDPLNYASIDQGFVLTPDGTTAASNPAASYSLSPRATIRNLGMCFDVAAPGSGSYTLNMHEARSKTSAKLVFLIP
jgi:hypothetical protein